MRFRTLGVVGAREALKAFADGKPFDLTSHVVWSGSGSELDPTKIDRLVEGLKSIRARLEEKSNGNSAKLNRQEFDRAAAPLLHAIVPHDPELIASMDFWTWLAVVHLRDLIVWRFPPKASTVGEPASWNAQNFGVGQSARQRSENFPYKLWLRAELAFDAGHEDKYRFARRGDVDFWTSHIHRQSYSSYRPLGSALIRFQYPDQLSGEPRLHPGEESDTKKGIRTLAKRLKRLQANVEFGCLSREDFEGLVVEQARGLNLYSDGSVYEP